MTTRASNFYLGARTRWQPGYSVRVCDSADEVCAEVAGQLRADGFAVRVERGGLWIGDGPDVDSLPQDAPEEVE
jgi:hypothetical protein